MDRSAFTSPDGNIPQYGTDLDSAVWTADGTENHSREFERPSYWTPEHNIIYEILLDAVKIVKVAPDGKFHGKFANALEYESAYWEVQEWLFHSTDTDFGSLQFCVDVCFRGLDVDVDMVRDALAEYERPLDEQPRTLFSPLVDNRGRKAKVTEEQARDILHHRFIDGHSIKETADKTGCHRNTVIRVSQGKTLPHIAEEFDANNPGCARA